MNGKLHFLKYETNNNIDNSSIAKALNYIRKDYAKASSFPETIPDMFFFSIYASQIKSVYLICRSVYVRDTFHANSLPSLVINFHLIGGSGKYKILYHHRIPLVDEIYLEKNGLFVYTKASGTGSDDWIRFSSKRKILFKQINGMNFSFFPQSEFKIYDIFVDSENFTNILYSTNFSTSKKSKCLMINFGPNYFGDIDNSYNLFILQSNDHLTPFYLSVLPLFEPQTRKGYNKIDSLYRMATVFIYENQLENLDSIQQNMDVGTLYTPEVLDENQVKMVCDQLKVCLFQKKYSQNTSIIEFIKGIELSVPEFLKKIDAIFLLPNEPYLWYIAAPLIRYTNSFPFIIKDKMLLQELKFILEKLCNTQIYSIIVIPENIRQILKKNDANVKIICNHKKNSYHKVSYYLTKELILQIATDLFVYNINQVVQDGKDPIKYKIKYLVFYDELKKILSASGLFNRIKEKLLHNSEKLSSQRTMEKIYQLFPRKAIKYVLPSLKLKDNFVPGSFIEEQSNFYAGYEFCRLILIETSINLKQLILAAQHASCRISPIFCLSSVTKKSLRKLSLLDKNIIHYIRTSKNISNINRTFMDYMKQIRILFSPLITKKLKTVLSYYDLVPHVFSHFHRSNRIPSKKKSITKTMPYDLPGANKGNILLYLEHTEVPFEYVLRNDKLIPEWATGRMSTGKYVVDYNLHINGLISGKNWENNPKLVVTSTAQNIPFSDSFWLVISKMMEVIGKYEILGLHGSLNYSKWKTFVDDATLLLFFSHGRKDRIALGKGYIHEKELINQPLNYKKRMGILHVCSTGSPVSQKEDNSILFPLITAGVGNITAPIFPIPFPIAFNYSLNVVRNIVQGLGVGEILRWYITRNMIRNGTIPGMYIIYGEPSFRILFFRIDESEEIKKKLDEFTRETFISKQGILKINTLE